MDNTNEMVALLAGPARGAKRWPHPLALAMLDHEECQLYYEELRLYIHLTKFRGALPWGAVNAAAYVAPPGGFAYTTAGSLQGRWARCRAVMRDCIRVHNRRAGEYNLGVRRELQRRQQQEQQQQQQFVEIVEDEDEDEDEDDAATAAEAAMIQSTILAMRARIQRG